MISRDPAFICEREKMQKSELNFRSISVNQKRPFLYRPGPFLDPPPPFEPLNHRTQSLIIEIFMISRDPALNHGNPALNHRNLYDFAGAGLKS